MVKQLAVFVENETGSLSRVTEVLKDNNINIRALASFDSPEFGILRMIVDKTGEAKRILTENHFIVKLSDVLAIELQDQPGALDAVLRILATEKMNVNYIYSFVLRGVKEPLMIMNLDDCEKAAQVLRANGVTVVDEIQ